MFLCKTTRSFFNICLQKISAQNSTRQTSLAHFPASEQFQHFHTMTNQAILLRYFPVWLFMAIAVLSLVLGFNGLYGQDSHEYLRLSKAIFDLWTSHTNSSISSYTEFGIGYPATGALLQYLVGDARLGLQILSWFSFGMSAWIMNQILAVISHGSRADSRFVFILLSMVAAPVFLHSGFVIMSDAFALMLTLAAFFYGLRWIEYEREPDTIWAAICITLAISVRLSLAPLLIPLGLILSWFLFERGNYFYLAGVWLAALGVLLFNFVCENNPLLHPFQHSNLHWSFSHFWQRSFQFESGLTSYAFPNILYLFFPLMHPGFCVVLPGLYFLAKKTDLTLPAKKTILFCLVPYLLLIGGLPHQNLRFLLPVYMMVLLIAFPAWDRLYCYGLYFFKRLTWAILLVSFTLQIVFCVRILTPTIKRNRLEQSTAKSIRPLIPEKSTLYGFDLDIAMRTYLPEINHKNLWEEEYAHFTPGAFVLFNPEALKTQWEGLNPMINWKNLNTRYKLETVQTLENGWTLYQIADATY